MLCEQQNQVLLCHMYHMLGHFSCRSPEYLEHCLERCFVKMYHAKLSPGFVFVAACAGEKGRGHL